MAKNKAYIGVALNLEKDIDKEVYDALKKSAFDNQASFIRKAIIYYGKHEKSISDYLMGNTTGSVISNNNVEVEDLKRTVEALSKKVDELTSKKVIKEEQAITVSDESKKETTIAKKKNDKPKAEKKEANEEIKEETGNKQSEKEKQLSDEGVIQIDTNAKNTSGDYTDFMAGFFENDDK